MCKGADFSICFKDGASPLYVVSQNGHNAIVQLNLDYLSVCRENKDIPFLTACYSGHGDTVLLLLSNGADINIFIKTEPVLYLWLVKMATIPLYDVYLRLIACNHEHESTLDILVSNVSGCVLV